MTQTTRKNVDSTFTNFTVNKGVEAKNILVPDARLDTDMSSSSRAPTDSGALAAGDAPTSLLSDQSASFVQVVVQKQHGAARCTGPTRPRLPSASSPAPAPAPAAALPTTLPTTLYENGGLPAAVLLACPAFAALHQQSWEKVQSRLDASARAAETFGRVIGDRKQRTKIKEDKRGEKTIRNTVWKNINGFYKQDLDFFEDDPERIEVYHFESGGEYLSARGAARATRVERAARRVSRPAAALLRELISVPRCLLAVPISLLLHLERCSLECVRNAVTGVVQTASDLLLKPILALVFNAMLRPPLVCATQVLGALRDALRPLAATLGDAVEPLARLLSSLRLVHIERRCKCTPV